MLFKSLCYSSFIVIAPVICAFIHDGFNLAIVTLIL